MTSPATGPALAQSAIAETGDLVITLLTITHASIATPIRVVADYVPVTSRGNVFQPYPFELTPPAQQEGGRVAARLAIDNVDAALGQTVRGLTTPATVQIERVVAADPDTVEEAWPLLKLTSASITADAIEGELTLLDRSDEPACQFTYRPGIAPGLFRDGS